MDSSKYNFSECRFKFLAHLNRMEYSFETIKGYEKDLQFFQEYIACDKGWTDFVMEEVSKSDLIAFIDYGKEKGHKPNTIARRLSTIKSFYKFMVNELDYPIDVAARVRLPKVYIPLLDILNKYEIKLLLNQAAKMDAFYHMLFSLIYYTGSRLTPVRTLEKKNVRLEDRVLYFPRVKGGRDLYLPLHDKLVHLLTQHFNCDFICDNRYVFPSRKFPNQPISAADVRLKLKLITDQAGISKRVTPHQIRHCTATHLTINKVDQRRIANILGHTDLRSTARYQHLSIEHLREPINVLE
ncbi:tyrosine-type recombinase/integrase [Virgibacillus sp. FSP13]